MLYPERCKATPLVTPTTTECSPRKPPASHTQIAKSQIACGKNRHIDNQIFMDLYSVSKRPKLAVLTADYVKGTRSELGVAFQGRSSAMRLTGWSAMRVSTSRR